MNDKHHPAVRTLACKTAPLFRASKWLHLEFLIDSREMGLFLEALAPCFIFSTLGVQPKGHGHIFPEQFLQVWQRYIHTLRSGEVPSDSDYRFSFTSVISKTIDAVIALDVGGGREVIAPSLPIVQLQLHRFDYSFEENKFRPMVFGSHTISWGLRLSYPQLFQDPETEEIQLALDKGRFENAHLFATIQSWLRAHTLPTPLLINGVKVNVPMRIGRDCLSWINSHAELKARGLAVA